jgi:hypothetical protein
MRRKERVPGALEVAVPVVKEDPQQLRVALQQSVHEVACRPTQALGSAQREAPSVIIVWISSMLEKHARSAPVPLERRECQRLGADEIIHLAAFRALVTRHCGRAHGFVDEVSHILRGECRPRLIENVLEVGKAALLEGLLEPVAESARAEPLHRQATTTSAARGLAGAGGR